MSLAAPAMLLALLALPVLALLYLLRPRPRQRSSATWFLWQAVLHQRRASAWWRRLREWLGLVLLALSIIAIALALAEPRTDAQAPQDLVLLIDSSASMTAPGRMPAARQHATELLAALPPGQRALVASVDARLRLHMPLSSDHGLLRGAIDRVQARPAPLRSDSLRTIAADPSRRVVLISDGCFTGELPDHVHLQSIASDEARNAGIVQADCRLLGSGELALFARIAHNHSDNSVVDMAIRHESHPEPLRLLPARLQVGEETKLHVRITDARPGCYQLRLRVDDALACDDTVDLVQPPPDPIRTAVQATQPRQAALCVQSLGADGRLMHLVRRDPELLLSIGGGAGGAPANLVFAPAGSSPLWRDLGDVLQQAAPECHAPEHPVLRHSDPLLLPWQGARQLRAAAGARVLVSDVGGTPLLYLVDDDRGRHLVVNAAPAYLSTAFPVLVHDAARHLCQRPPAPPAVLPVGDALPLPPGSHALQLPDGTHRTLRAAIAEQPGLYRWGIGREAPDDQAESQAPTGKTELRFRAEPGLTGPSKVETASIPAVPQRARPSAKPSDRAVVLGVKCAKGRPKRSRSERTATEERGGVRRSREGATPPLMEAPGLYDQVLAAALFSAVDSRLQQRAAGPEQTGPALASGRPLADWLLLMAAGILLLEACLHARRYSA